MREVRPGSRPRSFIRTCRGFVAVEPSDFCFFADDMPRIRSARSEEDEEARRVKVRYRQVRRIEQKSIRRRRNQVCVCVPSKVGSRR